METKGKAVDSVIQYQLHRKTEGGGDSENDLMVINVLEETQDENTIYVLDKNYNEILNHISQGKPVLFENRVTADIYDEGINVYYSYNTINLYDAEGGYNVDFSGMYSFGSLTSDGTLVLIR